MEWFEVMGIDELVNIECAGETCDQNYRDVNN